MFASQNFLLINIHERRVFGHFSNAYTVIMFVFSLFFF